ncbi:7066_t:CDS:1, partial [Ambispora gerdemannii]
MENFDVTQHINFFEKVVNLENFSPHQTLSKVKRPANQFLVFRKNVALLLKSNNVGWSSHMKRVTALASTIWKGANEQERKPFADIADEIKKKHKNEHPEYAYRPVKKNNDFKIYNPTAKKANKKQTKSNCSSPSPITIPTDTIL